MAEAQALNEEEQKLFDSMRDGKPEPKEAEKPAAKEAAKEASKEAPKEDAKEKEEKAASVVPAAALKEARAQNKELRKEIDDLKKLVSTGDEKLKRFIDGLSKQAEAQAVPKYEEDAAGHLKHETEALKKQNADLIKAISEVNAKLAAGEKAAKDSSDLQKFAAAVRAREVAYAKEHPDYDQAAEFVAQVWRDEFAEAGIDEENIAGSVFQKSLAITQQATAKGKDPAEVIYKIAQRYGWKTPEAKDKDAQKEKKQDGDSKLQALAKGLEAAKKAGGGDGPDDATFASLAGMDDEAIDKLVSDPNWWAKNIRRTPLH